MLQREVEVPAVEDVAGVDHQASARCGQGRAGAEEDLVGIGEALIASRGNGAAVDVGDALDVQERQGRPFHRPG
jgi:hypothetical protein